MVYVAPYKPYETVLFMALLKALCWALIFILRIRFLPGISIATVLKLDGSLMDLLSIFPRFITTLTATHVEAG